MPIKLNFKRTHRYNVSAKDLSVIPIYTLDESCIEYTISSSTTGKDALDFVAQRLDIEDTCFFGLKYQCDSNQMRWIFLNKTIKKQLDKFSLNQALYLGIMLFVDNPQYLPAEKLRRQFYLQLRRDIANGLIQLNYKLAIKLCAYSLQADYGDFVDVETAVSHWREHPPISDIALPGSSDLSTTQHSNDILLGYCQLRGVPAENAIWHYLDEVRRLPDYDVQNFQGESDKGSSASLGVSRNGLTISTDVYDQDNVLDLKWQEIRDLTYSKRTFTIQMTKHNKPIHLLFVDSDSARYLWHFCVQMHNTYIHYWTLVKSTPKRSSLHVLESPLHSGPVRAAEGYFNDLQPMGSAAEDPEKWAKSTEALDAKRKATTLGRSRMATAANSPDEEVKTPTSQFTLSFPGANDTLDSQLLAPSGRCLTCFPATTPTTKYDHQTEKRRWLPAKKSSERLHPPLSARQQPTGRSSESSTDNTTTSEHEPEEEEEGREADKNGDQQRMTLRPRIPTSEDEGLSESSDSESSSGVRSEEEEEEGDEVVIVVEEREQKPTSVVSTPSGCVQRPSATATAPASHPWPSCNHYNPSANWKLQQPMTFQSDPKDHSSPYLLRRANAVPHFTPPPLHRWLASAKKLPGMLLTGMGHQCHVTSNQGNRMLRRISEPIRHEGVSLGPRFSQPASSGVEQVLPTCSYLPPSPSRQSMVLRGMAGSKQPVDVLSPNARSQTMMRKPKIMLHPATPVGSTASSQVLEWDLVRQHQGSSNNQSISERETPPKEKKVCINVEPRGAEAADEESADMKKSEYVNAVMEVPEMNMSVVSTSSNSCGTSNTASSGSSGLVRRCSDSSLPTAQPQHQLTNSDIHQLLGLMNVQETALAHRLLADYHQTLLSQHTLHTNSVSTPNLSGSQELMSHSSSSGRTGVTNEGAPTAVSLPSEEDDTLQQAVAAPRLSTAESRLFLDAPDGQAADAGAKTRRRRHRKRQSTKHTRRRVVSARVAPASGMSTSLIQSCRKSHPAEVGVTPLASLLQEAGAAVSGLTNNSDSPDYVNASVFGHVEEPPVSMVSSFTTTTFTDNDSNATFRIVSDLNSSHGMVGTLSMSSGHQQGHSTDLDQNSVCAILAHAHLSDKGIKRHSLHGPKAKPGSSGSNNSELSVETTTTTTTTTSETRNHNARRNQATHEACNDEMGVVTTHLQNVLAGLPPESASSLLSSLLREQNQRNSQLPHQDSGGEYENVETRGSPNTETEATTFAEHSSHLSLCKRWEGDVGGTCCDEDDGDSSLEDADDGFDNSSLELLPPAKARHGLASSMDATASSSWRPMRQRCCECQCHRRGCRQHGKPAMIGDEMEEVDREMDEEDEKERGIDEAAEIAVNVVRQVPSQTGETSNVTLGIPPRRPQPTPVHAAVLRHSHTPITASQLPVRRCGSLEPVHLKRVENTPQMKPKLALIPTVSTGSRAQGDLYAIGSRTPGVGDTKPSWSVQKPPISQGTTAASNAAISLSIGSSVEQKKNGTYLVTSQQQQQVLRRTTNSREGNSKTISKRYTFMSTTERLRMVTNMQADKRKSSEEHGCSTRATSETAIVSAGTAMTTSSRTPLMNVQKSKSSSSVTIKATSSTPQIAPSIRNSAIYKPN